MRVTIPTRPEVVSDGRSVWVTMPTGMTVARFGPMGIDVHTADATGCLDCTHDPTGVDEWRRFQTSVAEHYDVEVGDEHCPNRVRQEWYDGLLSAINGVQA